MNDVDLKSTSFFTNSLTTHRIGPFVEILQISDPLHFNTIRLLHVQKKVSWGEIKGKQSLVTKGHTKTHVDIIYNRDL